MFSVPLSPHPRPGATTLAITVAMGAKEWQTEGFASSRSLTACRCGELPDEFLAVGSRFSGFQASLSNVNNIKQLGL